MDSFKKGSGKVKGIEVLFFENAELEKVKGSETSFAAFGPLSVLYFKDYNRFMLQINNWIYPLMRRFNISSSKDRKDLNSRTYVLPAPNGYSFNLKVNQVSDRQAIENFETILGQTSRFSIIGKEIPYRKTEISPENRLTRKLLKETGPKEIISETVKQTIHKIQNKAATLTTGTKNLTSTKKMINLKTIRNKNFKKNAKSRINKSFFDSCEKLSNSFLEKRKNNINLTQLREFDDLRKTSDSQAPSLYLYQNYVEDSIIKYQDMFAEPEVKKLEEKRGVISNLKESFQNVRERISERLSRDKNLTSPEIHEPAERMPLSEGNTHYQG